MQQTSRQANHRWIPLVVCPHKELGRGIRSALTACGLTDAALLPDYPETGAVSYISRQQCNICFLDLASDVERGLQLVGEAAAVMPVVALNTANDASLILRSLRHGAKEFLAPPITTEQVGLVLTRVAQMDTPVQAQPMGPLYCVVPGKAGCGASTFATHLALAMKALGLGRVLLADLDTMAGTIGFLLKIKTECPTEDALRDWKRMDPELWARLTAQRHGLEVLPSPEAATTLDLDRATTSEMLSFWHRHYNATVIDTGGGGCPITRNCAALADHVLVVSTNELVALHATARMLEWLGQGGVERTRIRVVLNRYTPSTGLKAEDVRVALKHDVFAILNNDYQTVQAATWEGTPASAGSLFGRSVAQCAARLLNRPQDPKPAQSRWWNVLRH